MERKRERASGFGLLPRMEARPHAGSDKVTYRHHPVGGKPINLGPDKRAAIQKVLNLNGASSDADEAKSHDGNKTTKPLQL
jgi:hypothetical protein